MSDRDPKACTAHSKSSGNPCKRPAIPGGTVCRYHGGAAPQVKKKAAERLAELVDPAITEMTRLLTKAESEQVRAKIATEILDRTGVSSKQILDVNITTFTLDMGGTAPEGE